MIFQIDEPVIYDPVKGGYTRIACIFRVVKRIFPGIDKSPKAEIVHCGNLLAIRVVTSVGIINVGYCKADIISTGFFIKMGRVLLLAAGSIPEIPMPDIDVSGGKILEMVIIRFVGQ